MTNRMMILFIILFFSVLQTACITNNNRDNSSDNKEITVAEKDGVSVKINTISDSKTIVEEVSYFFEERRYSVIDKNIKATFVHL